MDDRDYYLRRAEEELDRARMATAERVVGVHYQLAALYLDRVYGVEGDPRAGHRPAGPSWAAAAGQATGK